jgi:hypothetical protein
MRYSQLGVLNTDSIQIRMFSGSGIFSELENGAWSATFVKRSIASQAGVALY